MVLINSVTTEPHGNGLNGIIYTLMNNFGVSKPYEKGLIIPTGTENEPGYLTIGNTIDDWNNACWTTVNTNSNPFYQVFFPKHSILISGYSLRSCNGVCYPKKWKVYGFNEENKNEESKWDEIGENSSTSSQPYCYTSSDTCDTNFAVGTFTTKKTNKPYRYIRFVLSQPSRTTSPRFTISGFDVFGTLSLSKIRRTICTCIRKQRIASSEVMILIVGMSMFQS